MRSPICSGVHASSKSNFKQKASSYITHVCECLKPYQVSKTRRYDPNFGPNKTTRERVGAGGEELSSGRNNAETLSTKVNILLAHKVLGESDG